MTKKQIIWIVFGFISVVLAIIGINYAIKRKKARAMFKVLEDKIDSDVGANGADINSELYGSKVDSSYKNAAADAKAIYNADGVVWDDNDTVFKTLSGKTKGQLAAIDQSMQNQFGLSLDQVIKNIFDNCYFGVGPDCGEYDRAMKIIKSAS